MLGGQRRYQLLKPLFRNRAGNERDPQGVQLIEKIAAPLDRTALSDSGIGDFLRRQKRINRRRRANARRLSALASRMIGFHHSRKRGAMRHGACAARAPRYGGLLYAFGRDFHNRGFPYAATFAAAS